MTIIFPSKQYSQNYKDIEWSQPVSTSAPKVKRAVDHRFMPDIQPFQSPIDGTWVTSRSVLRDHEKKHNVVQVGNELVNKRKEKERPAGPEWHWTGDYKG